MPILPSRTQRIHDLIARLAANKPVLADSAVAQLTLLGPRAVEPLLAFLRNGPKSARLRVLSVLERVSDRRALPDLLELVHGPDDVASKAAELLGAFPEARTATTLAAVVASGPHAVRRPALESLVKIAADGVVEAIDPLVRVLLDETEEEPLRLRALDGLSFLGKQRQPLLRRLEGTKSRALAQRLATLAGPKGSRLATKLSRLSKLSPAEEGALFTSLSAQGLPAVRLLIEMLLKGTEPELVRRIGRALCLFDPSLVSLLHEALARAEVPVQIQVLAGVLAHYEAVASVPVLHETLKRLKGSASTVDTGVLAETKATVHLVLARLDSRIALYDLRAMLEQRPIRALPTLLKAAEVIGDLSVIPALVELAADEPACRSSLARIVRREGLTLRVVRKRVPKKNHARLAALWPTPPKR